MKARLCTTTPSRKQRVASLCVLSCIFLTASALSTPARAVDGCKVLLCMAGSWRSIAACEPVVREALRDLARGRAWPHCAMAGASQSANQYVPPVMCPEQYRTTSVHPRTGAIVYACPFQGAIQVVVEREPWSRTWWSPGGDAVIEWLPAGRAAFAGFPDLMDRRFDSDYAAWLLLPPPSPLAPPIDGGG